MSLSPNSSDTHPIKHLWFPMEISICALTLPSHSVQEFQDQCVSTSFQIPQTIYKKFAELLHRRVL